MKSNHLLLYLILYLYSLSTYSNIDSIYSYASLDTGCNSEAIKMLEFVKISNTKYTKIETNIDSVKIYFGNGIKDKKKIYWISCIHINNSNSFFAIHTTNINNYQFKKMEIPIEFDKNSKKVILQIEGNDKKNIFKYNWSNGINSCKNATIIDINNTIKLNQVIPDLDFYDMNNNKMSLSDFKNKYIVLNYWATNCAPCRTEIPGLNILVDSFKENKEIIFLAIANDKINNVSNFLKLNEFKYFQAIGTKETTTKMNRGFPQNIIIAPNNKIIYFESGAHKDTYLDVEKFIINHILTKH